MGKLHRNNAALLLCLFVVVLAIAATALIRIVPASPSAQSTNQQKSELTSLTDSDLKGVVIGFERTTCYGNCAAYKLLIHGDGRIEYEGEKNVKQIGKKQAHIQLPDIKHLVSEFDKASFLTIDQYSEKNCSCAFCTDMPTAITEILVKGVSHRVEHYYGCRCAPKSMWELEEAIDKIVHTEQWTGDVSKQGPFGTTCFDKRKV